MPSQCMCMYRVNRPAVHGFFANTTHFIYIYFCINQERKPSKPVINLKNEDFPSFILGLNYETKKKRIEHNISTEVITHLLSCFFHGYTNIFFLAFVDEIKNKLNLLYKKCIKIKNSTQHKPSSLIKQ